MVSRQTTCDQIFLLYPLLYDVVLLDYMIIHAWDLHDTIFLLFLFHKTSSIEDCAAQCTINSCRAFQFNMIVTNDLDYQGQCVLKLDQGVVNGNKRDAYYIKN